MDAPQYQNIPLRFVNSPAFLFGDTRFAPFLGCWFDGILATLPFGRLTMARNCYCSSMWVDSARLQNDRMFRKGVYKKYTYTIVIAISRKMATAVL